MFIENSHGEKLVGILHETGSSELVVICHGFRSTKVYDHSTILCIRLEHKHFQVALFLFLFCVVSLYQLQDRIPMVNLAFAFEGEGISAFRFDFAGNG